jgi:hypothetical protein
MIYVNYRQHRGDRWPLGPCGVSVACLLLSELVRLARLDLFLFLPEVVTMRGRTSLVHRAAKAEGRGRG